MALVIECEGRGCAGGCEHHQAVRVHLRTIDAYNRIAVRRHATGDTTRKSAVPVSYNPRGHIDVKRGERVR